MNSCKCCWHKHKNNIEFFKVKTESETMLSTLCQSETCIPQSKRKEQEDTLIEYLLRENDRKMKMIEELYKKNMDLENRIHKLEKREGRRIKKEIEEYLQEMKPTIGFTDWLETITITTDEFEYLDIYDYKECMMKIIKRLLKNSELPLCAFTNIQKNNVYIYSKTGWLKMEFEHIKSLIHRVDAEYNRGFMDWADKKNNAESEQYYIYLVKIDCAHILGDSKLSQIRKCIYDTIAK